jgi:hypothetical protein
MSTTAVRRRYTAKEKEALVANRNCYVCEDLQLDHAGFDGYDLKDIDLDHYQTPFSNVGGEDTDVLPIHAASGGAIPDELDFESSTRRNCHRLRGNDFSSRAAFVQVLKARLQARTASFVDDVYENAERTPSDRKYFLKAKWTEREAEFMGKTYGLVSEERNGETWRRFLATLRPDQVFTDDTSQVRPAAKKSLLKMLHTFLVEGFPMFAPVNARIDKCGHVVIFDGNHRATAHALAFGVEMPMPVMIWDIATGDACALRPHASSARTRTLKG